MAWNMPRSYPVNASAQFDWTLVPGQSKLKDVADA